MRGAVFVGAYSVPPAGPTASHAVTRSLYIEARNYGLSVFIYGSPYMPINLRIL